ncbi:MAG: lysozyme inhibitor LprI family protein, partial [Bdellovibrionota bacterium]
SSILHGILLKELEFKKKDSELNRIYRAIQKNENLDTGVAAAPSRIGIQDTQRNWIQYRDAWLAFANLKFSTVSQYSLSAALTSDRIRMLKKITAE